MSAAKLDDVVRVLSQGGSVRFTWASGRRELLDGKGNAIPLDGRTYDVVPTTDRLDLMEVRRGSTAGKDLVIEWHLRCLACDGKGWLNCGSFSVPCTCPAAANLTGGKQ